MARAGLKKVQKTVRGKSGTVKRSYWVRSAPKAVQKNSGRKSGNSQKAVRSTPAAAPKQSFLQRHKGKLLAGAAVAGAIGLAALNRNKLSGALHGAREGLARSKAFGSGKSDTARAMFQKAQDGMRANAHKDRTMATLSAHGHQGVAQARQKVQTAKASATAYRRTHGAALAEHLTNVGGEAAAHHIGSKFGQVAGTAIGSMAGGVAGGGIGGFLGGHAGGFLANRHTAPHIARGAQKVAEWMRR